MQGRVTDHDPRMATNLLPACMFRRHICFPRSAYLQLADMQRGAYTTDRCFGFAPTTHHWHKNQLSMGSKTKGHHPTLSRIKPCLFRTAIHHHLLSQRQAINPDAFPPTGCACLSRPRPYAPYTERRRKGKKKKDKKFARQPPKPNPI